MKIEKNILAVLESAKITGRNLALQGQLDRKTYTEVNKVLEAIGGKWNRGAAVHVFAEDAAELIDQILQTGEYSRVKQDFGQFDTPPELADLVVTEALIEPGMKVLEPSCGVGNIVAAVIRKIGTGADIWAYEIDEKRLMEARGKNFKAFGAGGLSLQDFMQVKPCETFDRVVMNPPFAKQADIDHVLHAFKFLKPGGKLVAIMSASVSFRDNFKTQKFREHVHAHRGSIQILPENSFKESGTGVNTVIVAMWG